MKEGPPKKGGQVRDSQKKNTYTHASYAYTTSQFLCVWLKVRSNPLGAGFGPPRGCLIFLNPDDLDVFGYFLISGLPDELFERGNDKKWIRCSLVLIPLSIDVICII